MHREPGLHSPACLDPTRVISAILASRDTRRNMDHAKPSRLYECVLRTTLRLASRLSGSSLIISNWFILSKIQLFIDTRTERD